jgi:hypothetical protein
MEEVENVMGESEAMPVDEEAAPIQADSPSATPADEVSDTPEVWAEALGEEAPEAQTAPPTVPGSAPGTAPGAAPETADPWQALAQVGAQLVSAFAAASRPDAPAHPWIERDPATGASSLKLPLPPPETARRLADTLQVFAEALRGRGG